MRVICLGFVLLLAMVFCSCKRSNSTDGYLKLKKMKSFREFIRLEKTVKIPNPIISNSNSIISIKRSKNYYLIIDNSNAIHAFNSTGAYLSSIRKTGKGPGEYDGITQVLFVDENSFFVHDGYRGIVNYYEIKEKSIVFKEDFDIAKHAMHSPYLSIMNDSVVAIVDPNLKSDNRVFMFDKKFNKKHEFSNNWKLPQASYEHNHCVNLKYIIFLDSIVFRQGKPQVDTGRIFLYDFNGNLKRIIKHPDTDIYEIHSDRDGRFVILFDTKQKVTVYNAHNGEKVVVLLFDFPLYKDKSVSFYFDDTKLYAYYTDQDVLCIDEYEIGIP